MGAAEWIGSSDGEKDKLDINAIASSLPPEASALKAALANTTVKGVDDMRRTASADAAQAKAKQRRLAIAVVAGSAVAALASGLLLYGQGGADAPASSSLVSLAKQNSVVIALLQIVSLLIATAAAGYLAGKDFGKLWTEYRREAETRRIEIFNNALALISESPGTGAVSPLRQFLEFFRRYQLDLQINYYKKAGQREDKSANRALFAASLLGGATVVLGLIGGISPALLFLSAFLGIAVPILLSAAQSWATTTGAAAKAAAYQSAGKALQNLRLDLTKIEGAADAGNVADVKKFMDNVHGIMSAENGAFVGAGPLPAPPPAPRPARHGM